MKKKLSPDEEVIVATGEKPSMEPENSAILVETLKLDIEKTLSPGSSLVVSATGEKPYASVKVTSISRKSQSWIQDL